MLAHDAVLAGDLISPSPLEHVVDFCSWTLCCGARHAPSAGTSNPVVDVTGARRFRHHKRF